MDAALLQQLMQLAQNDPQQASVNRQNKTIDRLRAASMGGLSAGPTQVGRTVVPNFGGQIASVMQGLQANKMEAEAAKQEEEIAKRRAAAQQGYTDALVMALRRPLSTTGQTILPPDGMEDR